MSAISISGHRNSVPIGLLQQPQPEAEIYNSDKAFIGRIKKGLRFPGLRDRGDAALVAPEPGGGIDLHQFARATPSRIGWRATFGGPADPIKNHVLKDIT